MDSTNSIQFVLGKELHTVSIHDGSGQIDLGQLREANIDLITNKKELCEKIFHLGVSMTGGMERASGFLMGWLTKSIKSTREKNDGTSWKIVHDKTELTTEELAEELATMYEDLAKRLRELKSSDFIGANPLVKGPNTNGTDLF